MQRAARPQSQQIRGGPTCPPSTTCPHPIAPGMVAATDEQHAGIDADAESNALVHLHPDLRAVSTT